MSSTPFRFLQRRTSTSGRFPDAESLLNGELFVQLADETIYFKNDKCQLVSVVTNSNSGQFGTGNFINVANNFGANQTWQTVSRNFNTNYTNNTSKPIMVNAIFENSTNYINPFIGCMVVGGITVSNFQLENCTGVKQTLNAIIPAGASYCFWSNGGNSSPIVNELR